MNKIPKEIIDLFCDPQTDSLSEVLCIVKSAHDKIIENSDFEKATLPTDLTDYKSEIETFCVPKEGIEKDSYGQLVANLYKGTPRWHSPKTMYNVAPPPVLATVATKTLTSLYNPNLVMDTASGESILTEKKVVKAIAQYIGWDHSEAGGTFTFGGKATTMYGIKLGLKKCYPESSNVGVKDDIVVISVKSGHPSHISDAEWLGIGKHNVMRLGVNSDGKLDIIELEKAISKTVKDKKKIAAIIVSGGTTNNMVVDSIKEVVELRDRLVIELEMDYIPHVHVDSVVGFPWIFFKHYNFSINDLNIEEVALSRIQKIIHELKHLDMADSFGIDFHKMGFCPYISSLFMVKNKKSFSEEGNVQDSYGDSSPFMHFIENSRSGDGPNSAFVVLNVIGEKGYQILLGHLTEIAIDLQNKIEDTTNFTVVNKEGLGSSVMFIPNLPSGISFSDKNKEKIVRNNYANYFISELRRQGNPYYIDKVPANSTGAKEYPFVALKAFVISPHSTKLLNSEFITFLNKLKSEIDKKFDFSDCGEEYFYHPLK